MPQRIFRSWSARRRLGVLLLLGLTVAWWFCPPDPLFDAPLATELLSTEGELLGAHIAADGQWRMPPADSVSQRLRTAVVVYEDRGFYRHPGVSGRGLARALRDNWRAGRIVAGGSTLTMQVARMARGNRARTLVQKLVEIAVATRLEVSHTKAEILGYWLDNAPFGGNVVGAEAAARRYFGRSPADLSWAEAATLAVLPNNPALIHPGRARTALLDKRNRLLDALVRTGHLPPDAAELAKLERLPERPLPLPRRAPHLLERLRQEYGPGRYRTSLRADLQREVTRLVERHHRQLVGSGIRNAAALVTEVATGRVVAYVGNVTAAAGDPEGNQPGPAAAPAVDILTAPRSPGSLLKPFLYALAQDDGTLLPRELLPDVPTSFRGFQPANFAGDYAGAVAADAALARSLNIPFVFALQRYGVPRFLAKLRAAGFGQLGQPPEHYGLSLILGGGEVTPAEVSAWFTGLARQQRYVGARGGRYRTDDFAPPTLLDHQGRTPLADPERYPSLFGAGAGYRTLEALTELTRPDETGGDVRFASHRPVAWKTGTSFGFRDAWAAGCTPAYAVVIWTGNADGEGRDGLVGVRAAAPLLFSIFRALDGTAPNAPRWFTDPVDEMRTVVTCATSGLLAGPDCPPLREATAPGAERGAVCAYHRRINVDATGAYRVRQDCGPGPGRSLSWFTLPPRQAHYYARRGRPYAPLPPWHPACGGGGSGERAMQFIYPYRNGVLSASRNWRGETEDLLFKLAHRRPDTEVHWHLDGDFVGTTRTFHTLAVRPAPGEHTLVVVDATGERLERRFTVR